VRDSAAWSTHAEELDAAFASFLSSRAKPFADWARYGAKVASRHRTLFYPFGGPDVPFASLLHPSADTYILCGREPVRPLSNPPSTPSQARAMLEHVRAFVQPYLNQSYFITTEMADLLSDANLPGIADVLAVLVARLGFEITSVRLVHVDPQGNARFTFSPRATGVCVEFLDGQAHRRLFYLQQDLRNDFFSQRCQVARFVSRLGPCVTFVKSGSYLMHEPEFRSLCDFILSISAILIQDPSGIRYRALVERDWHVSLHGRHPSGPRLFAKYEQADLVEAFDEAACTSSPLDFSIGYNRDPASTGLIVASPLALPQTAVPGLRAWSE